MNWQLAVGSGQWAVGSGQLAVGGWQLAVKLIERFSATYLRSSMTSPAIDSSTPRIMAGEPGSLKNSTAPPAHMAF
ncbi:MAG: hypothetical protein Fues2KO_38410 [Fuerstiella sp.]